MRQPNAVSQRRARLWAGYLLAEWRREVERQCWRDAILLPRESAGRAVERLQNTAGVDADATETLLDLAREGREADFRDLAGCLGVPRDRLDELWGGTMARLRRLCEGHGEEMTR